MVKVDETLHIHLGPNGQPLSFEWVRYDYTTMSCPPFEGGIQGGCREPSSGNKPSSVNGQLATATTLSDTYYYHYDIHGNVIKVTDSSATTKISYEYDVLGEITSVSNPDGITNPFTFRGATQAIYDEEVELYFGGGYYRADLGTTLSSSSIASNPTSGTAISSQAKVSNPSNQLGFQASIASNSRRTPSITASNSISSEISPSTSSFASSSDSGTYFWMGANLYRRNSNGVASMVSAGSDVYQQKQKERMDEPGWNYVSWIDELGTHHYGPFEEYHEWFMNQRLELKMPETHELMRGTPEEHFEPPKYMLGSYRDENGRMKDVELTDRTDPRGDDWREIFRNRAKFILENGYYMDEEDKIVSEYIWAMLALCLPFLTREDILNFSKKQQLSLNELYRRFFPYAKYTESILSMWLDLLCYLTLHQYCWHQDMPYRLESDKNHNWIPD